MACVREALLHARAALKEALTLDAQEAALEAHVLLGEAAGRPRSWLLAHPEAALTPEAVERFAALLGRRQAGEPVAYLLGRREFFGLELRVTPAVLIPRPETELLVELALAHIPVAAPVRVLDLGTGSGAVALALARHRPRARVTAVDRSAAALEVARENARRLGLEHVSFLEGDWFAPLAGGERFDLIVGNPPYVAEGDPHLARGDVRFEPREALAAGPDGLDALRAIAREAGRWLTPGGLLLLEHGHDQGPACRALFEAAGFAAVQTHRDLEGRERVTGGRAAV